MQIRHETEDWREQIVGWVIDPDCDCLDGYEIDQLADNLRWDVITKLQDRDFRVKRAYSQSRGSFVLFQSGTAEEKVAFNFAMDEAIAEIRKQLEDWRVRNRH